MDSLMSPIQRQAQRLHELTTRSKKKSRGEKLSGQAYLDRFPLTERQQKFVHNVVVLGMSAKAAAIASGTPEAQANTLAFRMGKHVGVLYAIDIERRRCEIAGMMTKKKVMDGFLEAIEMAKTQSEPMVMVAGWREVARMCGYFEPTRHKLEVTVQGEVVIQRLQLLDDHQLLQLADGNAEALDGEFQVVEKA